MTYKVSQPYTDKDSTIIQTSTYLGGFALCLVLIDDRLQNPVCRQGQRAIFIQEHQPFTHLALDAVAATLQALQEDVGHTGCSDVAARSAVAHDAAVCLADDAELVDVREVHERRVIADHGATI